MVSKRQNRPPLAFEPSSYPILMMVTCRMITSRVPPAPSTSRSPSPPRRRCRVCLALLLHSSRSRLSSNLALSSRGTLAVVLEQRAAVSWAWAAHPSQTGVPRTQRAGRRVGQVRELAGPRITTRRVGRAARECAPQAGQRSRPRRPCRSRAFARAQRPQGCLMPPPLPLRPKLSRVPKLRSRSWR
jgi:hypothetical protein